MNDIDYMNHQRIETAARVLAIATIVAILFSAPTLAQGTSDNPVCQTNFLSGIANTVIKLCIYGAGAGMFVTYIGTNALEGFPFVSQEQEQKLKKVRGRAIRSGFKAFIAGPVLVVLINGAGLPWASCINLVPF
ncbi:hypothetical protein [Halorussus sp. AFM4]|uniref:hypothetical protein n=1 Tax=Halorussus sp. AFM4 TaxID=3421651 RepID=UPI003EBC9132